MDPSGKSVKLHTVAAIEITRRARSITACLRHIQTGALFLARTSRSRNITRATPRLYQAASTMVESRR